MVRFADHLLTEFKIITICNYKTLMVEAAGVEPASENIPHRLLHT